MDARSKLCETSIPQSRGAIHRSSQCMSEGSLCSGRFKQSSNKICFPVDNLQSKSDASGFIHEPIKPMSPGPDRHVLGSPAIPPLLFPLTTSTSLGSSAHPSSLCKKSKPYYRVHFFKIPEYSLGCFLGDKSLIAASSPQAKIHVLAALFSRRDFETICTTKFPRLFHGRWLLQTTHHLCLIQP